MEFEHKGQKYMFFNAMEEIVFDHVRSAIKHDAEMCTCEKCFYDVCALVLNNLDTPKYATSQEGALMSKIGAAMKMENIGVLSVEIIKAINMVKSKPNH